jgi:SAM-dependent methyltransferase
MNRQSRHRWWKERDEPTGTESDLGRLAQINARASVPVEVAGDSPVGGHSAVAGPAVEAPILGEEHHRQYGGPWAKGKYLFGVAVQAGLRPEHRLLDFGCGSLRIGVWAIPYLEPGNYFGVDSHLGSLEAAATYEIPFNGLEAKRPRLLWDESFAFSHFGTTFDWIIDSATSTSVGNSPGRREQLFRSFAEVLAPGGRLLVLPRLVASVDELADWGLTFVRGPIVQSCSLLEGHDEEFQTTNVWYEFARA